MAVTRTKAEDELARQFAHVAPDLPGGDWVPSARAEAMKAFGMSGLPHRRIEEWKYTDLRSRLKSAYAPAASSNRPIDKKLLVAALGETLADLACIRLVLLNGRFVAKLLPDEAGAPKGWSFSSLADALEQPADPWMQSSFDAAGASSAPVRALNAAFVSDGIVLTIEPGAAIPLPIHLVSIVDADAPVAVATRTLVRVGAGASVTVLESHVGLSSAARQSTAVTDISVGDGGTAHHIQHLAGGADSTHLGDWTISLGGTGVYRAFQLTAGMGLARNETRVTFTGPDAKLDLSGLMLGRGRDHIDTTLVVDHATTGCESRELFKAVLDDTARCVFQGKIVVRPEAQKTDGQQMAQALMLSEDAEFDSKPELEIYADDVACGHGATVAEIDPAMMFYLRSRGIPKDQARAMLIESFIGEAIEKIELEPVREALRALALGWLHAAGGPTPGAEAPQRESI